MTVMLSSIKEATPLKTASGEEHGLMKVVSNSVPDSEGKRFKEKDRASMKKLRDEESKMVKAVYINTKGSKYPYEMSYCNWDGDPILSYKFLPDQEYEIPKGLADKVNSKKIQKRSGLLDKGGKELMSDTQELGEHRFVPTGF